MFRNSRSIKLYIAIIAAAMVLYEVFRLDTIIGYLDGKLYYQYLPEWFIEKNLGFYVKYPFGTAIMEAPFFLVAHLLTLLINASAATGYGGFYEYAVGLAGVFYFVAGTMLIFKALTIIDGNPISSETKDGRSSRSTSITIIFLTLGTFLPYYARLRRQILYLPVLTEQKYPVPCHGCERYPYIRSSHPDMPISCLGNT